MAEPLGPHSPQWFKAMVRLNPIKALLAREYIRLAQSDEVCGTCGANTARDYELPSAAFDDGSVVTARLCGACVLIEAVAGERSVPMKPGSE